MGIRYENLDDITRASMVLEIQNDIEQGTLYLSNYLTDIGKADWPNLLKEAAQLHDDDWLAQHLRLDGRLLRQVQRRKPKGGFTMADVPVTANTTMAEGEFNRFYIRAICVRAIEAGHDNVLIYRGRHSADPRSESEMLVGNPILATGLLNDLREKPGVDAALGLAKPNSGLSVKLMS
ncbi:MULTISPECIES: hypothetical protein [Rhodomicrobium]|uniref:hypothetical protein n=1 Tax=Rhodomicrobium TaxID=1068 RepID=UPI000F73780D|nr:MULTISPECIES: hypothetical protein [Rhodomicrobium]